jgi:hypothetical protein
MASPVAAGLTYGFSASLSTTSTEPSNGLPTALDPCVFPHPDRRIGIDLDHDVGITIGQASPRAREPNNAAWATPRSFSAASCSRNGAMMS